MSKLLKTFCVGLLFSWGTAQADEGHNHASPMMDKPGETPTHGSETPDLTMGANKLDIYGKLWLALEHNDPGDDGNANTYLISRESRVGLRGNRKLDKQLLLFWQVESTVNLDNLDGESESSGHHATGPEENEAPFQSLDSFIGISGKFGRILGGKHTTAYRSISHNWDHFSHLPGDSSAFLGVYPGFSNPSDHHGNVMPERLSNTIMFSIPSRSGFHATIATSFLNETTQNPHDGRPRAYSMNVAYNAGPIILTYGREEHRNYDIHVGADGLVHDPDDPLSPEDITVDKVEANMIGAMFHPNKSVMVSGIVENIKATDVDPAVPTESRTAFHISAQYTARKNVFRFAYGNALETEPGTGAQYFAIAYARKFAKNTEMFASAVQVDNDDEANYGAFHVNAAEHGNDPLSIATGVIYSF